MDEVNKHASDCETYSKNSVDLFKENRRHSSCSRDPFDFDNIIANDGTMHALHNLAEALREAMPSFKTEVRKLKHLVRFLRSYDTRLKLLERCFNCPNGRLFHRDIKAINVDLNVKRWGTIAFAVPLVLAAMKPLRKFWSLSKYNAGSSHSKEQIAVRTIVPSARG